MTGEVTEALGALSSGLSVVLGKSDYRVVRLVFLSTIAAWCALDIMRTLAWVVRAIRVAIVANLPPLPEICLLLGLATREQYERGAYPVLRTLERAAHRIEEVIRNRGKHV